VPNERSAVGAIEQGGVGRSGGEGLRVEEDKGRGALGLKVGVEGGRVSRGQREDARGGGSNEPGEGTGVRKGPVEVRFTVPVCVDPARGF